MGDAFLAQAHLRMSSQAHNRMMVVLSTPNSRKSVMSLWMDKIADEAKLNPNPRYKG